MGATMDPWVYREAGHPFDGIPLDIVQMIGNTGAGGFSKHFDHFLTNDFPAEPGAEGVGNYTLAGVTGDATLDRRIDQEAGVVRLTNSATAGGNAHLLLSNFLLSYEVGKQMWVFARMALADADDQLFWFGIATVDTDWNDTLPADGIFFEKAETDTDFDFHARKDGTSTENAADFSVTLADDTFFTIGFYISPTGTITPYYSADSATFTAGTSIASTDANVPDEAADVLYLQVMSETGAGAADYVDIDWIMAVREN